MQSRNWASTHEVLAAFKDVGHPLESTADEALAAVDHPLAAALRRHRAAAKLAGTYGRAWLDKHAPRGEVLPTWRQIGADSGRMSCSDPNLQQVPRGASHRQCFVARLGCLLVKADYSQIELRIAAKVAGEHRMIEAYQQGQDLHVLTAAAVTGKPVGEVAKADRQLAKAINFGLVYGMGARSLRVYAKTNYGVELSEEQARGYREAFFRAYPALRDWHRRVEADLTARMRQDPAATTETRTLAGRRRVLAVAKRSADGRAYPNLNEALNTPVQGTGADGLKAALAFLWEWRHECPGAVPVLFVHDEVCLEVPEADADRAKAWLVKAMTDGMAPLIDPVPVEVEATVGRTWGG